MQVADSWDSWKAQLGQAVAAGEKMGMSQQSIANKAEVIGDFLANKVDPKIPEQRALKELWQVASEQEQQAMASALVKLAQNSQRQ